MLTEAIDFRFLLIDNYKKLGLSDLEMATVLVIYQLLEEGNQMINADLLSLKMSASSKEIDSILASLLKKNVIDYVVKNKNTITTLEPLKKKLYKEFQLSLSQNEKEKNNKDKKEAMENIYTSFQDMLGRPLSPVEVSKIREWISIGYTDKNIIDALKEVMSKGKKSMRSVDKVLLEWSIRKDIDDEGHSSITENYRKNLEETIKIAKTPWLNDDKENK